MTFDGEILDPTEESLRGFSTAEALVTSLSSRSGAPLYPYYGVMLVETNNNTDIS
jgi:hypothetical protein